MSFSRMIAAAVFGYDYFISYAHRDGASYATALADTLTELNYSCFIDHSELPAGEALTPSLKRALRKSKALILIATEEAGRSSYVRLEVDTFLGYSRRIIPITVDGVAADAWPQLTSLVYLPEDTQSHATGKPSDAVLKGVRTVFRFDRRAVVVRRIAAALVSIFFALSVGLAWQGWRAQVQARRVREATIVSGAGQTSDPSIAALLLKELDPSREPREAAALTYRLITNGLPRNVLRGHTASVRRAAINSRAELVVSASEDEVLLWPADGTSAATRLLQRPVADVAFSPAGDAVVIARSPMGFSKDAIVVRWLARTDAPESMIEIEGMIEGLSFTADGSFLMVRGRSVELNKVVEGWVRLLRFPELEEEVFIGGHLGEVTCVGASRDGAVLATAGQFGPAFIWRTGDPHLFEVAEGTCVDVSQDGRFIAVGRVTGEIELRETARIDRAVIVGQHESDDAVIALSFSPDGRWLVSGSTDQTAGVWQLDAPDRLRRLHRSVEHDDWVNSVRFDPSGEWVLSRTTLTARVFHRDDQTVERTLTGPAVNDARFSTDGKSVVTACEDGTVRIWPVSLPSIKGQFPVAAKNLNGVAVSSDGERILSVSADSPKLWALGHLRKPLLVADPGEPVWDAAFAMKEHKFVTGGFSGTILLWSEGKQKPQVVGRCAKRLRALSLDASEMLVLGVCDTDARVWSLPDGAEIARLKTPDGAFRGKLSRSGRFAAIDSRGQGLFLWELKSNSRQEATTIPVDFISALAFSPGDDLLAVASDKEVLLMTPEGKQLGTPLAHPGTVNHLVFSPDGRLLAAGTSGGAVRISSVHGLRPAVFLDGHSRDITGLAFNSDGTRLATASMDGTVRVWPADGLGESVVLQAQGPQGTVQFLPDGNSVVSGSWGGMLFKWTMGWSPLARVLNKSINACLTPNDRLRLLGEEPEAARQRFVECEKKSGRPGISPPQVRAGW